MPPWKGSAPTVSPGRASGSAAQPVYWIGCGRPFHLAFRKAISLERANLSRANVAAFLSSIAGAQIEMLFDKQAISNKIQHLDEILRRPEIVDRVLVRQFGAPVRRIQMPRVWEPGGGSTLYRIETPTEQFMLKIKHRDVWVETRLESESKFTPKSSLENEHEFFQQLSKPWVPKVLFFSEEESFQFLCTEWLEPFAQVFLRG